MLVSVYRFTKAADVRAQPHTSITVPLHACERENVIQCVDRVHGTMILKKVFTPPKTPDKQFVPHTICLGQIRVGCGCRLDFVSNVTPFVQVVHVFSLVEEGEMS